MYEFPTDIEFDEKLGEGSFAVVYRAHSDAAKMEFAIKQLKKRYQTRDEVEHMPEIQFLRALQGHPNIITLFEVNYSRSSGLVCMVFELLHNNLYEFLRNNNAPLDERLTMLFMYQLLKAINYMHSKNLFHRDIKPENCMINEETFELKLIDFGSARTFNTMAPYTEYVATRWYRAPECILTSGSYGPAVDIWAVGCILYECLSNRPLFPGKQEIDQIALIHNILGTPSSNVLDQFRSNPNSQINFAFPQKSPKDLRAMLPNVTPETVDLLKKLLKYNPQDRISAYEALLHPAFRLLRAYDQAWTDTNANCPFSFFVMTEDIPREIYDSLDPGPPIEFNEELPIPKELERLLPKPASLLNTFKTQQKKTLAPPSQALFAKTQHNHTLNANLLGTRLKAAQRIQEYKHKKIPPKNPSRKAPSNLMLTFGNPSFLPSLPQHTYQKPHPSMIQPRIKALHNAIHV